MDAQSWSGFMSVAAGLAATLSGLVFLAVSINLQQVIRTPGIATLALESLTQLFGAMIIGLIALTPGQSSVMLGAEVTSLTCVLWLLQTRWQLSFLRQHHRPWRWTANRFLRTQLACLPLFFAGVFLWSGRPSGFFWFVPGMPAAFIAGVTNAWVLLVTIVRTREASHHVDAPLVRSGEGV